MERPPLPLVVSTKFRRKNEVVYILVFNLQECKNKILKLQVRIEQENEVKIKLISENGGHLPKLDERRAQEHLEKLGRRVEVVSLSLLTSS